MPRAVVGDAAPAAPGDRASSRSRLAAAAGSKRAVREMTRRVPERDRVLRSRSPHANDAATADAFDMVAEALVPLLVLAVRHRPILMRVVK